MPAIVLLKTVLRSITVATWVTKIGRSSFHLGHELTSRAGHAATAASVLVVHDGDGSRPLTEDERAGLARYSRDAAGDS